MKARLILRLLLAEVLPGEIGRLVERDFELPASATLRHVPNFKFMVMVRQKRLARPLRPWPRGPRPDRYVWLTGEGAKDARTLLIGGKNEIPLFTSDMIRKAREDLGKRLGQSVTAWDLRLVARLGLIEGFEFAKPEAAPSDESDKEARGPESWPAPVAEPPVGGGGSAFASIRRFRERAMTPCRYPQSRIPVA